LFHILPESRMTGGIDASMMMSDGTCRFVMPLLESTIAMSPRAAWHAAMSAAIASRSAAGRLAILAYTSPSPLLAFTPSFANVAPCFSNTSRK